jgi:hypothetical protein
MAAKGENGRRSYGRFKIYYFSMPKLMESLALGEIL